MCAQWRRRDRPVWRAIVPSPNLRRGLIRARQTASGAAVHWRRWRVVAELRVPLLLVRALLGDGLAAGAASSSDAVRAQLAFLRANDRPSRRVWWLWRTQPDADDAAAAAPDGDDAALLPRNRSASSFVSSSSRQVCLCACLSMCVHI